MNGGTLAPQPVTLEWKEVPTESGVYIECHEGRRPKLVGLVMEDGAGPVDAVPTMDCKESWWLGPIPFPKFSD